MINQETLALCIDSGFLKREERGQVDEDELRHYVPSEYLHEWAHGGIRPTEEGLARMDSILPMLLNKHNDDE
jgi:oxygen-independent coproporphyrinogen-3 oxidase